MIDTKIDTKVKHAGYKRYYTHFNYFRPILVYVGKNDVYTYTYPKSALKNEWIGKVDDNKHLYTKFIKKFKFDKIFIGKSPLNEMTKFSEGYGPYFNGNSILLNINKNNNSYIFIGKNIIKFTSYNPITKFVSPVGDNYVPYPYAIDNNNLYYLLIDDIITIEFNKNSKYDNPYYYYYDMNLMTMDRSLMKPRKLTHNFQEIDYFYIDKEDYTLTYTPNPIKKYNRLMKHYGSKLSIIKKDGTKIILNKKSYSKLMRDFGEFMKFKKIKSFKYIMKT
jgi:hypothetical protein